MIIPCKSPRATIIICTLLDMCTDGIIDETIINSRKRNLNGNQRCGFRSF